MKIKNTLSGKVEEFIPNDYSHIRMYVCGPTVYDKPHIGNIRSLIVFDNLYRLLLHKFKNVTFVRNITDVDDKIMKRAKLNRISIMELTTNVYKIFQNYSKILNILPPTIEPKATENINEMIAFIEKLLEHGKAYISNKHILFNVHSDFFYGCLSKKSKDELLPGARVEVKGYKKHPLDFVLWKPSSPSQVGWDSPWGFGRPGWHIECSAMCQKYLGEQFDIHGGGSDLIFPHHENEIAQNRYFKKDSHTIHCNYWIHNGLLLIKGKKMSKSLKNVIFLEEALANYEPEVIRYFFASIHYSKTCDWTHENLIATKNSLNSLYYAMESLKDFDTNDTEIDDEFFNFISDDMNFPGGIFRMHQIASEINKTNNESTKITLQKKLKKCGSFMGFLQQTPEEWFHGNLKNTDIDQDYIEQMILSRNKARLQKDFLQADLIRNQLKEKGILLEDSESSSTWRKI